MSSGPTEFAADAPNVQLPMFGAGLLTPPKYRFIRFFGGDSSERNEVRRFHPEGMSAISRGLSVCDTPGTEAQNGDLHPEGMLAGSRCQAVCTVPASLQDATATGSTSSGGVASLNPRLIADILSG